MSEAQNQEPAEETHPSPAGEPPCGNGETPGAGPLSPELKVVALTEQLEAALSDADKFRNEVQYKEAELQTVRRRASEERLSAVNSAKAGLVRAILPALESLALASAHIPDSDPLGQGVKLVSRQFADGLKSEGVTPIDPAAGTLFDPMEHEAQGSIETPDYPPGHIAQVIRPGYRLPDRVIQPAQVIVAR